MTHLNLRVEVQGPYILVTLRGTCLRAKFRKQDAAWLAMDEYKEDLEASITFKEFRTLACRPPMKGLANSGGSEVATNCMRP